MLRDSGEDIVAVAVALTNTVLPILRPGKFFAVAPSGHGSMGARLSSKGSKSRDMGHFYLVIASVVSCHFPPLLRAVKAVRVL